MSTRSDRRRAFERVEEAATELIYRAAIYQQNSNTAADRRQQHRQLLEAAREYGAAVFSLARSRTAK